MKAIIFFSLFPFLISNLFPQPNSPNPKMWGTSDNVLAIAVDGNYTYIGGAFKTVGPSLGHGVKLTSSNSSVDHNFPVINGEITAVIPDGYQGWYIGGNFTKVGDKDRLHLARINQDGSVNDWNPGIDGFDVYSMAVIGSSIYLSGNFSTLYGVRRLIKLNSITGEIDPGWNPNPNGAVYTLCTDGTVLYAGGEFLYISGKPSARLAKLDPITGVADPYWKPTADFGVQVIKTYGNDVYIGGNFSYIGGNPRKRLARLNNTSGALDLDWNPGVDGCVYDIAFSGNSIYAAGDFDYIGGLLRYSIAKLNNINGAADISWNFNNRWDNIYTIAVNSSGVFIGGNRFLSKLDLNTGNKDTVWSKTTNDIVIRIALNGDNIFAGGTFNLMGTDKIQNLARINNITGELDRNWNPNVKGPVYCIEIENDDLYAGGSFNFVGENSRSGIAKFNKNTGALDLSWNAGLYYYASIRSIAVDNNNIFAGGDFVYNEMEQHRRGLTKLNKSTGVPIFEWDPFLNHGIRKILLIGDYIYMCGAIVLPNSFTFLARLNKETGIIDQSWAPAANLEVYTILLKDNSLYAAGDFTSIGGVFRNKLAKLNLTNGNADFNWNPNANNTVRTIAAMGSNLFVGGAFEFIGSKPIRYLAKINSSNGAVDTLWNPGCNGWVISLAVKDDDLYAGGLFSFMNNTPSTSLALFTNRILSVEENCVLIKNYILEQNYPNPFNPQTTISFDIPKEALTSIKVYDILGKEIAVLLNDLIPAGKHKVNFNAAGLASGVYFYRVQSGIYSETKKMILLR